MNNAGILRTGYFEDLADREIDAILDIHLKAPVYVTQAASPVLARTAMDGWSTRARTRRSA